MFCTDDREKLRIITVIIRQRELSEGFFLFVRLVVRLSGIAFDIGAIGTKNENDRDISVVYLAGNRKTVPLFIATIQVHRCVSDQSFLWFSTAPTSFLKKNVIDHSAYVRSVQRRRIYNNTKKILLRQISSSFNWQFHSVILNLSNFVLGSLSL